MPNHADAGTPGTGYYDKKGKFVVYGPHHLGAGYVGPVGPAGHPYYHGRHAGSPTRGGYPHAGYGGAYPNGGYGGYPGHGYGGHGYGPQGHPGHWAGGHPGYGGFGYPGPHSGYLPGDLEAGAYGRKYAASPVRLYGSPSASSRASRKSRK